MYDYKVSARNHLDNACRAFAVAHNITDLAKDIGVRPATLRSKLNPDQPHQLTLLELLAITDHTEDPLFWMACCARLTVSRPYR